MMLLFFSALLQNGAAYIVVETMNFDGSGFWNVCAHIIYWLFPRGWRWSEAALALVVPGEPLDVNWLLEAGHFGLSFALFFALVALIFRNQDV